MSKETTTVETKVETAVTPPKEEAPIPASEVDYEAELTKVNAELVKTREEKENYRKGLLKAKGKLPGDTDLDDSDPEELETLVDRKVNERFLSTKEAQLQAAKDAIIEGQSRRLKELEVALKNRGQITSTSAAGSNQDKPEVKTDSYFSPEQIQSLKAKGWDDKKIEEAKKNMQKGVQVPH